MDFPPEDDERRGIGAFTERIRTGARRAFAPSAPATAVTRTLEQPSPAQRHLPVRYQLKDDTRGPYLTCLEASNITVRIERGLSVSSSGARKYPKGTIFLDGAAQGPPFMDASKGIYNLDHHEDCVRAFTLASCEQAMVVIMKGLDLDDESWTVWANEPDFDTVLAIWLLLNHRRLDGDDPALRRRMMPLVRLQGVIDAHGFELQELTGFPPQLQKETLETINELRREELGLKESGEWGTTDLLEFTHGLLRKIDELVYSPGDFEGMREVEELARLRISPQRLAVACRSDAGIYEVEEHLKEVHGDRLGLVILQKDDRTYTLRQVDPFLPTNLDDVYDRLNLLDPAVSGTQRWGGSNDIGGSPRGAGTNLGVDQILEICRWVYQPPSAGRRLATVFGGLVGSAAIVAASVLVGGGAAHSVPGSLTEMDVPGYRSASLILLGLGLVATLLGRARSPGYFGTRRMPRVGFLGLLVACFGLAALSGGWAPLDGAMIAEPGSGGGWGMMGAVVAGAAGIELLLRGALYGTLLKAFPVELERRWSLSTPTLVAALAYAAAVVACLAPAAWMDDFTGARTLVAAWVGAALVMGLVLGIARERWRSVWAPVVLQTVSAVAVWWIALRFFGS